MRKRRLLQDGQEASSLTHWPLASWYQRNKIPPRKLFLLWKLIDIKSVNLQSELIFKQLHLKIFFIYPNACYSLNLDFVDKNICISCSCICFERKGEMATHVLLNYFLAFGGAQVQVLQLAALQCLQQWYLLPLFN